MIDFHIKLFCTNFFFLEINIDIVNLYLTLYIMLNVYVIGKDDNSGIVVIF